MKAGLFALASVPLLQLVVARAALHQNHQHLHDKRAPAVVYKTVTDSEYEYYDSVDVIVYKDAQGKPLSTVTHWKGQKQVSTSLSTSYTTPPPPPPAPTTTSSSPPPPPPSSSSSAAPPPPAPEEKIAEPVHHQPAPSPPAASSAPPAQPSGGSSSGGGGNGKGVAFNTPEQFSQVPGISWACNWSPTAGVDLGGVEFVPQLWGQKDGMSSAFSSAVSSSSPKNALFYNEPDNPQSVGGSEIDVETAIGDFVSIMKPLQSKGIKVSSPCVGNNHIEYLQTFLSDGRINGGVDILCFHWYGDSLDGLNDESNPTAVPSFVKLAKQYNIPQVWLNEWAVLSVPEDLSPYTQYLNGAVDRYAYNMNDMKGSTGY